MPCDINHVSLTTTPLVDQGMPYLEVPIGISLKDVTPMASPHVHAPRKRHLAKHTCSTGSSRKNKQTALATPARLQTLIRQAARCRPPAAAARQTCFVAVPKHGALAAEWALHSAIQSEQEGACLIVPRQLSKRRSHTVAALLPAHCPLLLYYCCFC